MQMRLQPDECHHCAVARRQARERYAATGASDEWIAARIAETVCAEHLAEREERERRERRRLGDQRRTARRKGY